MLTPDLARVYLRKGDIKIRAWKKKDVAMAKRIAEQMLFVMKEAQGQTISEIENQLNSSAEESDDTSIIDGLKKGIFDRCRFGIHPDLESEGVSAEEIRKRVFLEAAKLRSKAKHPDSFERDAVIENVAAEMSVTKMTLENGLFADTKSEQRLVAFDSIGPDALVRDLRFGQLEALLLRAERMVVDLQADQENLKLFFNRLKFHGLLFRIFILEDGYRIEIEGPYALFSSSTKYGLKLALLSRSLMLLDQWRLSSTIRWGRKKKRARLSVSRGDFPTSHALENQKKNSTIAEKFAAKWEASNDEFLLHLHPSILKIEKDVLLPDGYFELPNRERVFADFVGFWSKQSLFRAVKIAAKSKDRFLFFARESLRVSEQAFVDLEKEGIRVLVYKSAISVSKTRKILREMNQEN